MIKDHQKAFNQLHKVLSQEDIVEQVRQWRTSVSGVNWDEELTNM